MSAPPAANAAPLRHPCERVPPEQLLTARAMPGRRRLLTALLLVSLLLPLLLAGGPPPARAQEAVPRDAQGRLTYVPGEVLVQLKPGLTPSSIGAPANARAWSSRILTSGRHGAVHRMYLAPGASVASALAALRADPAVQAASPNYLNYPLLTPTDHFYGQQWSLNNTGQYTNGGYSTHDGQVAMHMNGAIPGADIDAERAWDFPASGSGVIVAVIDTGVDYTHADLVGQMWDGLLPNGSPAADCPRLIDPNTMLPTSPGGPPSLHGGCDITDGDNDPAPAVFTQASTHGTHVAGIIAAANQGDPANGGIVGIAFNARIMALQVLQDDPTIVDPMNPGQRIPDPDYGATDGDIISAIDYAAANGASVINLSLGRGGGPNSVMTTAVENAIAAGVVLVAAAGNSNMDNLSAPIWPANYAAAPTTKAGFISVAASDQADQRASFSDYGLTTVDIAAPGVNIASAFNSSDDPIVANQFVGWAYESGTSQASPTVAGVAALLRGAFPLLTPADVKTRILATGDPNPIGPTILPCFVASNKRVNAYNALLGTVTTASCSIPSVPGAGSTSHYGCLATWLTEDWLPRRALDPLRQVREFLWQRGEWGRALVRFYYRGSGRAIAWLEAARATAQVAPHTALI